jgi:hypothetical protein
LYVVCVPVEMDQRRVVRGGIGCPVCGAEYPIVDGVVHFEAGTPTLAGDRPAWPTRDASPLPEYDAAALRSFIALEGAGGYVLLVGAAGRLGAASAELHPGVHFFSINPPDEARPTSGFSVLRSPEGFPVKRNSVRAVVVGADHAVEPWLGAAAGSLLKGLRFVAEDERASVDGIVELARGGGLLVGEKRAR